MSSGPIGKHRELHSAGSSSIEIHKCQPHTLEISTIYLVMGPNASVPSTAACTTFPPISENPPSTTSNDSQADSLAYSTSASKLQVILEYSVIFIIAFLNHLTCIRLCCCFYQVPMMFLCVINECGTLTSHFPMHPMVYIRRHCIAQ